MTIKRVNVRTVLCLLAAGLVIGLTQLGAMGAQEAESKGQSPTVATEKLDLSRTGVHRSGPWEYRYTITNPGTRSEGTLGELFFAGKPVEEAALGDYYHTPWGNLQWVGDPLLAWEAHGWMLQPAGAQGGKLLPEPWVTAGGPVVMMMVLREAETADKPSAIVPWVQEEMIRLGVKTFRVERPWQPLNDQAVTIHDTKMTGTLLARLAPVRNAGSLDIILDGTVVGRVDLPRRDGATKLVRHTLRQTIEETHFYLAFRVDRAAPAWPQPLEIGPDSNGKTVPVKGTREVIIALPANKATGEVWMIKSIQGDSIKNASVKAAGQPQFAPATQPGVARAGTFENTLRVMRQGKSTVELELKRPWQTDKAPEKTFSVTLDIQEVPSFPADTPSPK